MLTFFVGDLFIISLPLFLLSSLTRGFMRYTSLSNFVGMSKTDIKLIKSDLFKKNFYVSLLKFCFFNFFFFYIYLILLKTNAKFFLNTSMVMSEFGLIFSRLLILFGILFFILFYLLLVSNFFVSLDFIYCFSVLLFSFCFLIFSNNLLSFFFILELTSFLIFYKFCVSNFFFENSSKYKKKKKVKGKKKEDTKENQINTLFYQYWIGFFSNIFIFYFFIKLEDKFASVEWSSVNKLIMTDGLNLENFLLFFLFIFGLFFKIGFVPFHVYKIEVYKGLPYVIICTYTVLFFIGYLLIFSIVLLVCLKDFVLTGIIIFLFFVIGFSLYALSGLFDVFFIKSFFAYSSVVNTVIAVIAIILYFF